MRSSSVVPPVAIVAAGVAPDTVESKRSKLLPLVAGKKRAHYVSELSKLMIKAIDEIKSII